MSSVSTCGRTVSGSALVRSISLLFAVLGTLIVAYGATTPAQSVYPGLLVALPVESGITVRWACPPIDKESVSNAHVYDFQMGIDASGAPWFGYKGDTLQCPTKSLLCTTSPCYSGYVFLENGALLLYNNTNWGYLVPPVKQKQAPRRPPVITYQPVAALPMPEAQLFAGTDGSLFFTGKNPATGKYEIDTLVTGDADKGFAGPTNYLHIFSADEPITAVTGTMKHVYAAVGKVILSIAPDTKSVTTLQRLDTPVHALVGDNGILYYATASRVGVCTECGTMELLTVSNARIAARGGTLYVGFADTLGVLALDHAANLAKYDLHVPAVPTAVTPTVRLTGVKCFDGGETVPPEEERVNATTFIRKPGRYLYVLADVDNLQNSVHKETVRIVAARENGGLYYENTVNLDFEVDTPSMWGWVRFGEPDYPPYPGQYTVTTYLNGARADERIITVNGTATVEEAATNFDVSRLQAALKQGGNANARVDGMPLLINAVEGYNWSGSTPEERHRRISETVRLLLKYDADVKARNATGETALHRAAWKISDNADVITMLLKAGADINARDDSGKTSLHKAMLFGNLGNVKALLVKGVDVNARDEDGHTPLVEAVQNGYQPVVEALLAKGANPMITDNNGEPVLFSAAANPDILLLILKKAKVDLNVTATVYRQKHSLLGFVIQEAVFGINAKQLAKYRQLVNTLCAQGADLLPEETKYGFISRSYRVLNQTLIERILKRNPDALEYDTATIDDATVQRAAIHYLLTLSREQLASATSIIQYKNALEYCTEARKRMQQFLKPESTWLPEVFYNCALLEAHLGDFTQAKDDLRRYLALSPNAKDAKALQALLTQYTQQETALREPITPAMLVGVWWPDGPTTDRDKFFRVEFARRNGQLQVRMLAQQRVEDSVPVGDWVPVEITGNRIDISDVGFRTSTSNDYGSYSVSLTLNRVGDNRLIGHLFFRGSKQQDGNTVPNNGSGDYEWRQRK
ncbi:MAG TPA: ankyrin repeat domain-containing protein [Armatimonadota bacterium]|nr:ankyrin repeat domain-containing protein [Armatimonadota bacterium]